LGARPGRDPPHRERPRSHRGTDLRQLRRNGFERPRIWPGGRALMRRPAVLTGIGLLCAVLTTSACGTRMNPADLALAEGGGLQLTSQAATAPGAANPGTVTAGTGTPADAAALP